MAKLTTYCPTLIRVGEQATLPFRMMTSSVAVKKMSHRLSQYQSFLLLFVHTDW
jgi:hypothetical protein